MKVKNFLLSLVSPIKMRRYRNMSALVALAIFLTAIYAVCFPIKINSKNTDKIIEKNGYASKEFYDMTSDFDYNQIKECDYKLDLVGEGKAKSYVLTTDVEGVKKYVVNQEGEGKHNVYLVFDLTQEEFDNDLDIYTKYELTKEKESFAMLFGKTYYQLQTYSNASKEEGVEDYKASTIQALGYAYMDLTFKDYNSTKDFMNAISTNLASLYGEMYTAGYTLSAIIMVFVLPLLVTLLMWLFSRKNGALKRFKEYYNIASISAIIPILITFIVGFFYDGIVNMFTTVFVIYYIFVIFRINTTRDSVD